MQFLSEKKFVTLLSHRERRIIHRNSFSHVSATSKFDLIAITLAATPARDTYVLGNA